MYCLSLYVKLVAIQQIDTLEICAEFCFPSYLDLPYINKTTIFYLYYQISEAIECALLVTGENIERVLKLK